ncbi:MAG: IreB family regulatory phosphoprotein [Syntrophomonadaceae bacterium]|jgi:uncharacterized protein (UPF0297 family)
MPQITSDTVSFNKERDNSTKVETILQEVYKALEEKGYNPINQLVGYMISGDPAYITSHNDARDIICKVDRDEILEILLKYYLKK